MVGWSLASSNRVDEPRAPPHHGRPDQRRLGYILVICGCSPWVQGEHAANFWRLARRHLACQQIRYDPIPCFIGDYVDDADAAVASLVLRNTNKLTYSSH